MPRFVQMVKAVDGTGVPQLLARLFVGGMFAYLAYNKIVDPFEFLKLTREYQIFPEHPPQFLNIIAAVVPWLEILTATALILGVFMRGAAAMIFGMLMFFAPVLLIRAWSIYTDPAAGITSFCDVRFDCGCGTGEVYICSKMLENTAMQLAVLIPLFTRSRLLCLSQLFSKRRPQPAPAPAQA